MIYIQAAWEDMKLSIADWICCGILASEADPGAAPSLMALRAGPGLYTQIGEPRNLLAMAVSDIRNRTQQLTIYILATAWNPGSTKPAAGEGRLNPPDALHCS